jgi:hypothetical protein
MTVYKIRPQNAEAKMTYMTLTSKWNKAINAAIAIKQLHS